MPPTATSQLEQALRQLPPIAAERRTGSKYQLIGKHLERAAGQFPAETRLPPIRTLANIFGVTTVSIQRAITELSQRGILRAEVGRGVFIAPQTNASTNTPANAPPTTTADTGALPELELFGPATTRCTFMAASYLEHHKTFWQQTAERFQQQYPQTTIDIALPNNTPAHDADVHEFSSIDAGNQNHHTPRLNLADFSRAGGNGNSLTLLSPTTAPVHLHIPCLFYNKQRLAELGVAPPTFRSFDEQAAYMEQLPQQATVTTIQPLAWLGRTIQTLLDWLKTDTPLPDAERRQLLTQFEAIARLRRQMRATRPHPHRLNVDLFAQGDIPLFHGWSYNYGHINRQTLPFDFGVVPWLGSDDRLLTLPMSVAVAADTPHYAECIRLVGYLQSPESQQRLAETDNLPFHGRYSTDTFLSRDNDPAWIRNLFEAAYTHCIFTQEDLYLSRHIINEELSRFFAGRIAAAEALDEMLWLGRGTSQQLARRQQQAAQTPAEAAAG